MAVRDERKWGKLKTLLPLMMVSWAIGLPALVGATTRVGNSEIQLVYEMQQTFQADNSRS